MPSNSQPPGLYVLFFTEIWERFSFYGMRALLVLYMVAKINDGGIQLSDEVATAIYGLYTAGVYMAALPGGWIADRLLGAQRAVWYGGLVIAAGHFTLAIPRQETFFLGLILVALGTGMLKPNISSMVGRLYPEGGARRDAGFTIFYIGINVGAMIGPLICSALGEKINWHWGFGAAGVGMVLGLIQYRFFAQHLGDVGKKLDTGQKTKPKDWAIFAVGLAAVALITGLGLTKMITIDPVYFVQRTIYLILSTAVVYFTYLFMFHKLDSTEKKRLVVIAVLFIASAIFWTGYEQAGSTLNLFAERYTRRVLDFLNYEVPAGWFQAIPGAFVIILAPVAAGIWVALARRQKDISMPAKFALGLLFLGAGFLVMTFAAKLIAGGKQVLPTWLIATYLLHVIGELCISPVGLSSVTKLAPQRLVGQMMGIWFLATSLGNLCAGLIAGKFTEKDVDQMPFRFFLIVLVACGAGIVLLLLAKQIKKLMSGVK
jgi:proton-dependent oligopeptide transporter, POT family